MTATEPTAELSAMLAKGRKEYAIDVIPADDKALATLKGKYAGLPSVQTPAGYEAHRLAIAECVKFRSALEKRRKELKADSLEYGRRIDAFARYWTQVIEEIETPIREQKALIDDAKERERKAAEDALRLKQEQAERERAAALEAELRAAREADAARAKAAHDAEAERLRIEGERLAAETAKLAEERRAANAERERVAKEQQAAREKIEAVERQQEAERQAIKREQDRLERIEIEKRLRENAEKEARERVERERIEGERQAAQRTREEKEEAERLERMRTDVQHVQHYAKAFAVFTLPPTVQSQEARAACQAAYDAVIQAGKTLEAFKPARKKREAAHA